MSLPGLVLESLPARGPGRNAGVDRKARGPAYFDPLFSFWNFFFWGEQKKKWIGKLPYQLMITELST